MIKNIHLIYNDVKKNINNFNQRNFKLNFLYNLIENEFNNLNKNLIDIYLKVKYDDETYELYIKNQDDLNDVFNINKDKEIIIYIIEKEYISFNIDSFVSINQMNTIKLSQFYKIKYEQNNEVLKINKIKIKNGFKHSFKLINYGKFIPITSFLLCIPDDNDIFFLPSKTSDAKCLQEEDNGDIYLIYEVNILFKNINLIESKKYKLNYQLYDDKEGYISDEKGTLTIEIIDEKKLLNYFYNKNLK